LLFYKENSSGVGGNILDLFQFMDNFALAQLFLKQIFVYVPDIKLPPTPEPFFIE
jgi:hypothetical protein